MADIKENEMQKIIEPRYLRGVDAEGNSVLVNFAELRKLMFYNYRILDNVDANNLTEPGTYYLRTNITNADEWSLMTVFSFGWNTGVRQETVNIGGYGLKYRVMSSDGQWTEWRNIPIT